MGLSGGKAERTAASQWLPDGKAVVNVTEFEQSDSILFAVPKELLHKTLTCSGNFLCTLKHRTDARR